MRIRSLQPWMMQLCLDARVRMIGGPMSSITPFRTNPLAHDFSWRVARENH